MKRGPKVHHVETTWLQAFAGHYLPCEDSLIYPPAALRRAGLDILDLLCLMRRSVVVYVRKLEFGPGALWVIEGSDCDDNDLRASLIVRSQEMSIRVVDVERLEGEQAAKITA